MATWTDTRHALTSARAYHGCEALGGLLYLIGGRNSGGATISTIEAYDPVADSFTTKTPLAQARQLFLTGQLAGKIYTLNGNNGTASVATPQVFDPVANTCSALTSLPSPQASDWLIGCGTMDGLLYLTGGGVGSGAVESNIYSFNGTAWSSTLGINPLATSREAAPMIALNHKLYMVGGVYSSAAYNNLTRWDPINHWVQMNNTPFALRDGCLVVSNGVMYHLGGMDASNNVTANVYRYNEALDSWALDSTMLHAVHGAAAGVDANGNIYVFGGWATSGGSPVAYTQYYPIGVPSAPTATAASSPTYSGFTANCNAVSGATGYILDVATDAGFTSFVSGYNGLDIGNVTSYGVTGLSVGTYYYRFRAYNSFGAGSNSNAITAVTLPAVPTLSSPPNGATGIPTTTTLAWNASAGADSYNYQVAEDAGFSTIVATGNTASTNAGVVGLSGNSTYFWRINAQNTVGASAWSSVWDFTTPIPPPSFTNISSDRVGLPILIGVHGSSEKMDVTPFLDASKDITLTQERERDAFQRSFSDLKLYLSNLNGNFYDYFLGQPAGTMWDVDVIIDEVSDRGLSVRNIFSGVIGASVGAYKADTIKFTIDDEKAQLQGYTLDKLFWKVASTTGAALPLVKYVRSRIASAINHATVNDVLTTLIGQTTFSGIVRGIDAGIYAARPMDAFVMLAAVDNVRPRGTFIDNHNVPPSMSLDPSTTVQQVLNAMALYYNAQFYIEPATKVLTMAPRAGILNDLEIDITDRLITQGMALSVSDTVSKDYLSMNVKLDAPTIDAGQTSVNNGSGVDYSFPLTDLIVTFYKDIGGAEIESSPSSPMTINGVPAYITLRIQQPIETVNNVNYANFWEASQIEGIRIYAGMRDEVNSWILIGDVPMIADGFPVFHGYKVGSGDGAYYNWEFFLALGDNAPKPDIPPSGTISVLDSDGNYWSNYLILRDDDLLKAAPMLMPSGSKLIAQYAEGEGWTISDQSTSALEQNAVGMDITPQLTFVKWDGSAINSLEPLWEFFGGEVKDSSAILQMLQQFQDLMVTKRKITLSLKGLNYLLGDSVVINKDVGVNGLIGKWWIRSAVQHVMKQETEVEIVQV